MIQHMIQRGAGGIARLALVFATIVGATAVAPAQDTTGFNEAVGSTGLEWRTGGDVPWFAAESPAFFGGSAIRNGMLSTGETSWAEFTVQGPAVVSYRVLNSITSFMVNVANLQVDGEVIRNIQSISGISNPSLSTVAIPGVEPANVRFHVERRTDEVSDAFVAVEILRVDPVEHEWIFDSEIRPRFRHAMVYDSGRDRTVIWGGLSGGLTIYTDVYEFDGEYWYFVPTAQTPSDRKSHAMAYDKARGRTIMFGGSAGDSQAGALKGDTWEYDGSNWTEIETVVAPPARESHAMVYDVARGRVVLFGGEDTEPLGDTWEFDGNEWVEIQTTNRPSARTGHVMAYDEERQVTVLVGGAERLYDQQLSREIWEYDGLDWTQRIFDVVPPARANMSMTYDSARRIAILNGSSTWHYDGASWEMQSPATAPPARSEHAMAYDSSRGQVVMTFGKYDQPLTERTTWIYDGSNWTERQTYPDLPRSHSMVMDEDKDVVFFFGGYVAGQLSDSTWERNGVKWRRIETTPPAARHSAAMVYDRNRKVSLLFGGTDGAAMSDTWQFDGVDWSQLFPEDVPAARESHAMAHDHNRGRTVLFGGLNGLPLSDTWEFDGGNWQRVETLDSPSARSGHTMVYDSHLGKVILFGGLGLESALADTWIYDGVNWQQVETNTPILFERDEHSMAYNSARRQTVIFGGAIVGNSLTNETWGFNGTEWSPIVTLKTPPPAQFSQMVFSPSSNRLIMVGGSQGNPVFSSLVYIGDEPPFTPIPTPTPTPSPSPTPTPTVTTAVPTTVTPTITATATPLPTTATPSPTDTSTPVPTTIAPTATATATPSPTPTATTPVATPTVTPISPELVEALSSLTAENWSPVTVPEVYAEPGLEVLENRLLLNTVSNNSFGFHTTREPIGPLGAGRYRLVASIEPAGELPVGGAFPELRLRVTGENGLVNFLRADASTGSATEARSASTYFSGPEDGMFGVSVDILRFIENQAGGYAVTGFQLEPISVSAAPVESASLEIVEGNWTSTAFDGIFASPEFQQTEEGLLLSTNAANTFGFWSSTNTVGPLGPGLYELTASVTPQGGLAEGQSYPELRLRVTGNAGLVNVLRADATTGSSTEPRTLSVLFEATAENATVGVAVDILRFLESQGGGYLITGFALNRIE